MGKLINIEGIYSDELLCFIVNILKNGGVVLMPSDTVYGFLFTKKASERVRSIKRRDDKPFLFFVDNLERVSELGIDYLPFKSILDKNWPGAFTFIMDSQSDGVTTTSGVRMPAWELLRELVTATGEVLFSTSVNFSGEPPIDDVAQIVDSFSKVVDLIVVDSSFSPGVASTIVRLEQGCSPTIIRFGDCELLV